MVNSDRFSSIMIAGSASGVGKSTVTAGLCRSFKRRGRSVAPFKAQNMSNHAAVTSDGGEIGRAQANQAHAAGVAPTVHMNPLLLKPTSEMSSHVVVRGREVGVMNGFTPHADDRKELVLDSYRQLANKFDFVVAEGAGGAAEINLLDRDLVNLPFAAAAGLPAIVVVDIDRGGAFASAFGTIELLPPELRATVAGVIFNRFRGDASLLADGITDLERRTGVPMLGVLPYLGSEPLLGAEDSLDIALGGAFSDASSRHQRIPTLRVSAIALPHLSNPSDLDPLVGEPDVALAWTRQAGDVMASDLVILPGSRATVRDLQWLEETGLAAALQQTRARVVGICGGYQMLGQKIVDNVESNFGTVDGLGLLPVVTEFTPEKVVRQRVGSARVGGGSAQVAGYEIRFGQPKPLDNAADNWFLSLDVDTESHESQQIEGVVDEAQRVWGTSLHGLFDEDEFRRSFLAHTADSFKLPFHPSAIGFEQRMQTQQDRLGDWVENSLAMDQLQAIAETASDPAEMPGW